jgi:hypothetical protein
MKADFKISADFVGQRPTINKAFLIPEGLAVLLFFKNNPKTHLASASRQNVGRVVPTNGRDHPDNLKIKEL